ncbi:uncharacterized protein N7496_012402 [Penicillium cataractarum]|uniref:Transmembrane protein n=1 Tax=Penicillium cataractarum TaxID=2100454 RepID=A0A9W9R7N8_9EURO|nr:uncharacterized protein N7496_012402 [Penicillium cataractarum]KAJ5355190.1 hypothetical protein N7496_012402 [Penicillium cataractarum]
MEHLVLQWLWLLFEYCKMPYCVTFSYGLDYLSFVCSEKEGVEYQMEPYWSGFSDPIAFPVYTGSNGVSTGTQYPAGYSTPSSTTSSSSSTSTNSSSASSTSQGSSGSTASSTPSVYHGSSAPIGAIVGGVIGGLIFLGLIAGAIIFFLFRRRRRPQPGQPQQPAFSYPQGPPPSNFQYTHPANPGVNTGIPPHTTAPIVPPQNPPAQEPSRYEIETHYNKPELDISRQQPGQTYLNQQAGVPGMQPIQPEYVSMAQQSAKAELASHSGSIKTNTEAGVISAGHQGKEGNIYEAP